MLIKNENCSILVESSRSKQDTKVVSVEGEDAKGQRHLLFPTCCRCLETRRSLLVLWIVAMLHIAHRHYRWPAEGMSAGPA